MLPQYLDFSDQVVLFDCRHDLAEERRIELCDVLYKHVKGKVKEVKSMKNLFWSPS